MQDEYGTEYAVYEMTAGGWDGVQIASCDDTDVAHQTAEMFNARPLAPGRHYFVVTIEHGEDDDESKAQHENIGLRARVLELEKRYTNLHN